MPQRKVVTVLFRLYLLRQYYFGTVHESVNLHLQGIQSRIIKKYQEGLRLT